MTAQTTQFQMTTKSNDADGLAPGFYNDSDKNAFKTYFVKKKKRDRLKKKKRKRGRPRKETQPKDKVREELKKRSQMIGKDGLTPKARANLDARLEAAIAAGRLNKNSDSKRVNWDVEPNASIRRRCADSWINKDDLYVEGETFNAFVNRTPCSRGVLLRYIPVRKKELAGEPVAKKGKRGRPAHLSLSVMQHICEGTHKVCN